MTKENHDVQKYIDVYEKVKNKINDCLENHNDCLVLKNNKRLRVCHDYVSYQAPMLIYINHFKQLPLKNVFHRTCCRICFAPEHFILQTNGINYDDAWIRLSSKGIRDTNTNCLLWNGLKNKDGYGEGSFNGKTSPIHIISYKIKIKSLIVPKIDDNGNKLCIRHSCNNRNCYEQSHLELGTIKMNNYDDRIKHGTILQGEKNPNCNITDMVALKIKHSKYSKDHPSYKTVPDRAREFNVSIPTVNAIDEGRSWNHIPDINGNINNRFLRKKSPKIDIWTNDMFLKTKEKINDTYTKIDDTNCWKWNLQLDKGGYGTISINGQRKKAHVASCEAKYGYNKPEGNIVRHLCNNTWCVNPEHLEFGSFLQNNIDAVNCESNKNNTSLNVVREIKSTYKKDGLSAKERTVKYNISWKVLRDIEIGKTFKHIQ